MTENTASQFLSDIQSLIAGNVFNSSYKLALIICLADFAAEQNLANPKSEYRLSYVKLAERFLEIYWNQTKNFEIDRDDLSEPISLKISQEKQGKNLSILTMIESFIEKHPQNKSFISAKHTPDFQSLVKKCKAVVKKQPLNYLTGFEFLFKKDDTAELITIPYDGISYLQTFHYLVVQLAQYKWEQILRGYPKNSTLLKESKSGFLREFLFENQRKENLKTVRDALIEIEYQINRSLSLPKDQLIIHCFYCGKNFDPLKGKWDADHFLPWSKFSPLRLANFVPACEQCNRSKSDRLAFHEHLEKWLARLTRYGEIIEDAGNEFEIPVDISLILYKAKDLYFGAINRHEEFWIQKTPRGPLLRQYAIGSESKLITKLFT